MENLLDLNDQVETQPVSAIEMMENETTTQASAENYNEAPMVPEVIEEIDTAPQSQTQKASSGKIVTTPTPSQREEPPPNPLLLDAYEWDKCAITVGYSLLPHKKVSVSVHNHKDEPIVKEFLVEEVPLPEKITAVILRLQNIWPTSPVHATVVLLPKTDDALERTIIASVRVATDTPVMQEGVESDLPFPAPITAMLGELKAQIPERALKNIQRNAKTKPSPSGKTVSKSPVASKPVATATVPAATKNVRQNQMTLF